MHLCTGFLYHGIIHGLSRSILGMPKNAGIPRMDLDTEETREMHNLYIESIHGSLKNIIAFKEKNMNLYINVCDVCEY